MKNRDIMKNSVMVAVVAVTMMAMSATAQQQQLAAGNVGIGIDIGYVFGGDIETPTVAPGLVVSVPITSSIGFRFTGRNFSDEVEVTRMDFTEFSGSILLSSLVADSRIRLVYGGGFNWTQYDVEIGLPGYYVTVEDVWGAHVNVGASTLLRKNLELSLMFQSLFSKSVAEIKGPDGQSATVHGPANRNTVSLSLTYLF